MAIYHLSASIVKRSAGRSVTAAAAYRAADKIEDIKTGIIHDYNRKKGVDYSEIISPLSPNSDLGNEWLTNRAELWNKVELIEKRKDAQLAREVTIAIPCELPRAEQIALVREYIQTNYVAAGMIADVNLHHLDGDNPHAHILLTMRNLQTNPEGVIEFGLKNTDWNSKELLLTQRKNWEEVVNKYLAAGDLDTRIDCRSLKEQGSPLIPQIHVGVHAMAMKRKGIATDRGEKFDQIELANNDIRARLEEIYQQEYTEPEPDIQQLSYVDETIEERDQQLGELAFNITRDSNSFIKFQGYAIKQHHQNYIEVRVDGGAKILEIERKNEQWNININYPKYTAKDYSEEYVDDLVQQFEVCIRQPDNLTENKKLMSEIKAKRDNEDQVIGESIEKLLNLYNEKGRTFYPLRFEINKKADKIKIFDRSQGGSNYDTICELYLIDSSWQKSRGTKRVIIPIDNLDIKVKELINEASKVINFKSLSYIELSDAQKTEIIHHYAKNGDLQNSYQIRENKPHYSIEASRKMLEEGWDNKTVKSIFNILSEDQKPVITLRDEEKIVSIPISNEKVITDNRPPARSPITDGNPLNHIRNMLKVALENEQEVSTVTTPIIIPESTVLKSKVLEVQDQLIEITEPEVEIEKTEIEDVQVTIKEEKKPQRKKSRGFER